MFILYLCKRCV